MKELLQKKKNEKRVIKYALRKSTVGLVSVALSVSLISPVVVSASSLVQSSQEVSKERNTDGDPLKIGTASIDSLITSE